LHLLDESWLKLHRCRKIITHSWTDHHLGFADLQLCFFDYFQNVTDLGGIINPRISILFQAIQDGVLLRVNSYIGLPSEPFLLAIVEITGQLSLGGINHVSNVVRAEIVVKKQFISEPSIRASLRRFDVHPTRVFGTHVGQDVPSFAKIALLS
jgi:hypothetical protein